MTEETFGPYETEAEAAAGPICRSVYGVYGPPGSTQAAVEVHLFNVCAAAGISLGAYDRQVLGWLAGWEPSMAQALAGIVSRANLGGSDG